MPVPVRRPAAAAVDNRVNFGDPEFYTSGGGGIPEGRYALFFDAVVHQFTKQTGEAAGPEFLAVRVSAYALDDPAAEPKLGYYSMGKKAILSFMPNVADEGKSLVPVPNGPATTVNNSTNWAVLKKSMHDTGLPEKGVFVNDLSVLDGVWVHMVNIPEPEERKGFGGAQTGEVQVERRNQTIAVVGEILEGGMPWEGGGGLPEAPVAAAPKAAARPATRPAPKAPAAAAARPAARPAPRAAAPVVEEAEAVDDDLLVAAQNAVGAALLASPNGAGKTILKVNVFKESNKVNDGTVSQAILDTYFATDEALDSLLGPLGYKVDGAKVVAV